MYGDLQQGDVLIETLMEEDQPSCYTGSNAYSGRALGGYCPVRYRKIPYSGWGRMFRTASRKITKGVNIETTKIFLRGEKGSGMKRSGALQDFYKLRAYHIKKDILFEDPCFPCDDESVYFSHKPSEPVEWLRPSQIADHAMFFVDGFSRFDVQQGKLGNCWLVASVANLTLYRDLFLQVVPLDQGFDETYAGIFHFRFWRHGRWVDVVIDDRLPTVDGQLLFIHSTAANEFWSALLEKAYAKLHGSYEALAGGRGAEAMEDFTGGLTEHYQLDENTPNLFSYMLKAYQRGSLMTCAIDPDPVIFEARTLEGLVKGHAYSITKVTYVDLTYHGRIPLLRLRNPWGDEREWNGAWSDGSPEWLFLPIEEKHRLGLTFDADGEFWMSYEDLVSHFDQIEMCHLPPNLANCSSASRKWVVSHFEGEWVRGLTAGGCRNHLETFAKNPQYRITLTECDDEEDDNKCTVILALMQKNRRAKRKLGAEKLSIGFCMYHIPDPATAPKPLDKNFFTNHRMVKGSPLYINIREVTARYRLKPDTYCIIPTTFKPDYEGEFLLRVFSEHPNNLEVHYSALPLVKPMTRTYVYYGICIIIVVSWILVLVTCFFTFCTQKLEEDSLDSQRVTLGDWIMSFPVQ